MWYVCDLFLNYDDPMACILGDPETAENLQFETKAEALSSEAFLDCQDGAVFEPVFHSK